MSRTILIKYPTRERPEQFAKTLAIYDRLADDKSNTRFLITTDLDDNSIRKEVAADAIVNCDCTVWTNNNKGRGKIAAINSGMDDPEVTGPWDIVLLASDDMVPQVQGYDNLIREAFGDDLDQALWINDGKIDSICTIVCLGKTYFERFGYLYHPSYKSLWCDNEQTDVGVALGKLKKVPSWIKNESPEHGGNQKMDKMYQRNGWYYRTDQRTYRRRKAKGFPK